MKAVGLRQIYIMYGHRVLSQLRHQHPEAACLEILYACGCAMPMLLHVQAIFLRPCSSCWLGKTSRVLCCIASCCLSEKIHPLCDALYHTACQGS